MKDLLNILYSEPFPSTRTGALFNAYSYPTKISPEAIAIFIACHTKPGDLIFDPFGGSCTTGIATKLCDIPTPEMIKYADEHRLQPQWGPRESVVYELSPSGVLAGSVMCGTKSSEFILSANKLLLSVESQVEALYSVKDPNGNLGKIRHIIWSDVLVCPHCGKEMLYGDVAVIKNPMKFLDEFACPNCRELVLTASCDKKEETVSDICLGKKVIRKKRVPYMIYGQTGKKKWSRKASAEDFNLYKEEVLNDIDSSIIPVVPVSWGVLYRSGYHKGITHIHQFYTERNAFVFAKLWNEVSKFPINIQDALKIWLLSYNTSHSSLMTRVVAKKDSKDFVITGAQPGVLYISSLPVEKNILLGLERKIKTFADAFAMIENSKSKVQIINSSSTCVNLPTNSVKYVFTDPPFGDYIPYSEVNQINEAWLGQKTDNKEEVIINESQAKDIQKYKTLMTEVFAEMNRVMDSSSLCTLVFHSAKSEIWQAIISAYTKAGFDVKKTSILNKKQASFKQTNSTITVKGDPLILLSKSNCPKDKITNKLSDKEIAKKIISEMSSEKDSKEKSEIMFSRYITSCIELGVNITLDAEYFFNGKQD